MRVVTIKYLMRVITSKRVRSLREAYAHPYANGDISAIPQSQSNNNISKKFTIVWLDADDSDVVFQNAIARLQRIFNAVVSIPI